MSRQDLSAELTMAEGYEAFLSCTRSSRGRYAYSGVATFCRVKSAFCSNEVSLPIAAEEGFTGLLECTKRETKITDNLLELNLEEEGLEDITNEYLLKVDSEGRCVLTDHGHFVLFNLYGPRADDDDKERLQFKLVFFKVLQKRWESLLSRGKRVIVVGDLNIAPAAIDRCDADPGFEKNMFRKWLRSLFKESGGPFFDVFRSKHPERRGAYTHFSPHIGAEEFNYGSRIDHILIAGSCLHAEHALAGHNFFDCHAEECDIMTQFTRGRTENTPKWKGGRNIKLEGSDHIPVYAVLRSLPNLALHNTPSLAVRYIPEVRGRQQTIVSFLKKREYPSSIRQPDMSNLISHGNTEGNDSSKPAISNSNCGSTSSNHMASDAFNFPLNQNLSNSVSGRQLSDPNLDQNSFIVIKGNENSMLGERKKDQSLHHSYARVMKKAKDSTHSQLTLTSFFRQPKDISYCGDSLSTDSPHIQGDTRNKNYNTSHETEQAFDRGSMENVETNFCELNEPNREPCTQDFSNMNLCISSRVEKDNNAVLEWQKIQKKMRTSIPLCKGHNEPCVARTVKKGTNIGRRFYVCARAKGPESEPEANCNYFQWASMKSKQKCNK